MTLDEEIRLAKEEKELNKKVNSLMETLNITEGEGALLTLKYCETAETLREFDYKKNIFEAYRESKNYNKINELNETVNTAKNKIYSTDIEVVTEGYRDLAKVYVTLEEKRFYSKELANSSLRGGRHTTELNSKNNLSDEQSNELHSALDDFRKNGGEKNYQRIKKFGLTDAQIEAHERRLYKHDK